MTTRLHHTDSLDLATTDALRSLDPASVDPQVAAGPVAQATLSRILATDSAEPITPLSVNTGWARRPRRRWVVAGVALVGVVALAVAPGMFGGQSAVAPSVSKNKAVAAPRPLGGNTQFASWTPTATAITPAQAAAATRQCKLEYGGNRMGPGSDGRLAASTHTFLTERRGFWTFVLLRGPTENGRGIFLAGCLYKDRTAPGAKGPNAGGNAGGGGASIDPAPVVLAPNMAEVTALGAVGDNTGGTWSTIGRVGSDVASLVINTVEQGPVTATIKDGYFVAWWPGPAMHFPKKGEPVPPPPANPTFTLILKDGTVRANIPYLRLRPAYLDRG